MQAALCSSEETNPHIGESSYLRALLDAYRLGSKNFDDDAIFHFKDEAAMDDYQSFVIREFLERMLALYTPATSLVLKEPHLTMFFPELWKLIPESKFVMVKRDPRDIVVSMMRVGEKMAQRGQRHLFNSGNVGGMAKSITKFYAPTYNLCKTNPDFKKSCHWVCYEEFIEKPEDVMDGIRAFTGLKLKSFAPQNPYARVHPHKQKVDNTSDRVKNWLTPLNNQAIGRQKAQGFEEKLTKDQIVAVEKNCRDLIVALGYTPLTKAK